MMRVYVSGPYSSDPEGNTKIAIDAADQLLRAGYFPMVPHLSHFWHLQRPHDYETWMALDLAFLPTCQALLRLPGDSAGSDREVALANQLGIPVYYGVDHFLDPHFELAIKRAGGGA